VVVARFPQLKPYLHQTTASRERFHQNMFDAVALAIMVEVRGHRPNRQRKIERDRNPG
jgi:hypothetical protein